MLAYVYLGGGFIVETPVSGVVVLCRHTMLAAAAVLLPGMITQQRVSCHETIIHGSDTCPDDKLREAMAAIQGSVDFDKIQAAEAEEGFRRPGDGPLPARTPRGVADDVSDTDSDDTDDMD